MAKAAKVYISKELLEHALGLKFEDVFISSADIDRNLYKTERLVLILTGEGLPDCFTIEEGQKIKRGSIEVRHEYIKTVIKEAL